ncbi:hypothetical protein ABW20_dc0110258 [Dactylellina cionopaga]|nr:hypothetical protein ABW20_dc0110258 [Dactylellina cionopaga]
MTTTTTGPSSTSSSTARSSTSTASSNNTSTASPEPNDKKSSGSNQTAIIGGAVGGGVVLILVTAFIVLYFCRKDKIMGRVSTSPEAPDLVIGGCNGNQGGYGGYGGYGGGGNGGGGNGGGGGYGSHFQQGVGELDGNPAFYGVPNQSNKRFGASGSGIFETTTVQDAIPLRQIPRQELEAPIPPELLLRSPGDLPEMPRLPGPNTG